MAKAANDTGPRLKPFTIGLLVAVAIMFDALQFLLSFLFVLPAVGWAIALAIPFFITLLAAIVFGLWFKLEKVSFLKGKRAVAKIVGGGGALVAETVPLIDDLPLITGGVLNIIINSRIEDAEQAKKRPAANDNEQRRQATRIAQLQAQQEARAQQAEQNAEAARAQREAA